MKTSRRTMIGMLSLPPASIAINARAEKAKSGAATPLSVSDFGAVGDGKTDDTEALNRAFATPARLILLPKGQYSVSRLSQPACSGIVGEGERSSIIRVTEGDGLSLGSQCKVHRDYQLGGNASQGATGIHFGAGEHGAYSVENVRVTGFSGSDSVGIRYDQCLKSVFTNLTSERNNLNELWHSEDSQLPTTLIHIGGVSNEAVREGGVFRTGAGIMILGRDFESNGREGLLLQPLGAGHLEGIVIDGCWFEDNWRGSPVQIAQGGIGYRAKDRLTVVGGQYSEPMEILVDATDASGAVTQAHVDRSGLYEELPALPFNVSGGSGSGVKVAVGAHLRLDDQGDRTRKVWPSIRNCRFAMNTNSARAIVADGAGCNFTIIDEWLSAVLYPSIILENGASANFPSASSRYDYAMVVSDRQNRSNWALGGWREYGTSATAAERKWVASHYRFRRQGRTIHISLDFATMLAKPASTIVIALPPGTKVAHNGAFAVPLEVDGQKQIGVTRIVKAATNALLETGNGKPFSPGTVNAQIAISFEID